MSFPRKYSVKPALISAGAFPRCLVPLTATCILLFSSCNSALAQKSQQEPPPTSSTVPFDSGYVEYNETAPDTTMYPPIDVIDALNYGLIESPRAAAIRAQFGIAQAGYAQVTQVPNPIFFFDRGMVA